MGLLVILAGCSGEVGKTTTVPDQGHDLPVDGDASNTDQSDSNVIASMGAKHYVQYCAACHGEPNSTDLLRVELLSNLSNTVSAISQTMPLSDPESCKDTCAEGIVDWMVSEADRKGVLPNDSGVEPIAQVTLEPSIDTFRRASLLLAGKIPSIETLKEYEFASESKLKAGLMDILDDPDVKDFIKRGANDRLHVRGLVDINADVRQFYYESDDLIKAYENGNLPDYRKSIEEEPLELIAYVVMNDLPYGSILTANYTMVDEALASLYHADVSPNGEWQQAQIHGQRVRKNFTRTQRTDPYISIPHSGILSSFALNNRWPSTPTNRNRARAKYAMIHFLGFDIESSAVRDFTDEELNDRNNPTMNNPVCSECHQTLDPIAALFQDVGENGAFFDRFASKGADSLDETYVTTDLYSEGDSWYSDMRQPGYFGESAPETATPLNWLGEKLASDDRFAKATIEFWWPAIFGEEFFHDELTEQQRLQRNVDLRAWEAVFNENQNLKSLLVEMLMSPWFRAKSTVVPDSNDNTVFYTGGKRLLTPEEISSKAESILGIGKKTYSSAFNLAYGGIDSESVTERSRQISPLMYRVLERVAFDQSCNAVVGDFNRSELDKFLFSGVNRRQLPGEMALFDKTLVSISEKNDSVIETLSERFSTQYTNLTMRLRFEKDSFYLGWVDIKKTSGEVVFSGTGLEFVNAFSRFSPSSTSNKVTGNDDAALLTLSNDYVFNIDLSEVGEYQMDLSYWRRRVNHGAFISLSSKPNASEEMDIGNPETEEITNKIQELVYRLHGDDLKKDDEKIMALLNIFVQARSNKIARGGEENIVEAGSYCSYEDDQLSQKTWGYDPFHAMYAWKVVVAALMADFNFAYE